jgi:hypothetical protein
MFRTCFTFNNDGNNNIISRKSNDTNSFNENSEINFDSFLDAYIVLHLIRLTEFTRRTYSAELS